MCLYIQDISLNNIPETLQVATGLLYKLYSGMFHSPPPTTSWGTEMIAAVMMGIMGHGHVLRP